MVIALALILAALNAADWWTTRHVLNAGGFERNPLMRLVLERFGFTGLAVAKILLIGPVVIACWMTGLVLPLAILCAAYAVVVWLNWRTWEGLK